MNDTNEQIALGEISELTWGGGWTKPSDVVNRVRQKVEQAKQSERQLTAVIAILNTERDELKSAGRQIARQFTKAVQGGQMDISEMNHALRLGEQFFPVVDVQGGEL